MSHNSPKCGNRKFEKKELHRTFRIVKLDPDFDYDKASKKYYKNKYCWEGFKFNMRRSHNTKPLYKQIDRETIRKWDDVA